MKAKLLILVLAAFLVSCKQKTQSPKTEEVAPESVSSYQLPGAIKEIANFAGVTVNDSTDVDTVMGFKAVDSAGAVQIITMDEAVSLYKSFMKTGKSVSLPIFEIKDSPNCMLLVSERGFGGSIWGKLLVDRTTLEITKVEFDQKAESDEYGATAITSSTFENQFTGATINLDQNTFGLNLNGKAMATGAKMIDGISGATVTSEAVLRMMNNGLKKYRDYLEKPVP